MKLLNNYTWIILFEIVDMSLEVEFLLVIFSVQIQPARVLFNQNLAQMNGLELFRNNGGREREREFS